MLGGGFVYCGAQWSFGFLTSTSIVGVRVAVCTRSAKTCHRCRKKPLRVSSAQTRLPGKWLRCQHPTHGLTSWGDRIARHDLGNDFGSDGNAVQRILGAHPKVASLGSCCAAT